MAKADGRPPGKSGGLSSEDRALWKKVTDSVDPLITTRDKSAEPERATRPPPLPPPQIRPKQKPPLPSSPQAPGKGLDRRSSEKFRRGKLPIDGRLDLHGMTVGRAHARLDSFIAQSCALGRRVLLVITGKGRDGGQGILRREVPIWLSEGENRNRVLSVHRAQPRDGGDGALYVLLRRNRS